MEQDIRPAAIDKIIDGTAFLIERALALAFIAIVCLNFANVVGRYVFGHSILSADEIQIYIMIVMTYFGAAIVTWRKQHLRMDVLIAVCPSWLRSIVRVIEFLVFIVLAVFVTVQSSLYALQMFVIGRVSDMGEIPMWIPHSAIATGFGLMVLILLWRGFVAITLRTTTYLESSHGTDSGTVT